MQKIMRARMVMQCSHEVTQMCDFEYRCSVIIFDKNIIIIIDVLL